MADATCPVDGCDKPPHTRGFCKTCYNRKRRRGELPKFYGTDAERFWEKVDKSGDCWEWTGHRNASGYGWGRFGGKSRLMHRVSYLLATGVDPGALLVCHRCDNPPCVNPAHLFLGTKKDNADDMMAKGRGTRPIGEKCGKAKLTQEQVDEMRAARAAGEQLKSIAARYGIHQAHASRICSGQRWPS